MVKIHDPRADPAAVSMRVLRAKCANKCIKNIIKKNKMICEDKLKKEFNEIDSVFCEEFDNCSYTIKQELIFLWEEVGDLNLHLDNCESGDNTKVNIEIEEVPPPPPSSELLKNHICAPKRLRIFGP